MLLDIQTTIFMICLVYAVLHASTWLALQEYRSTQVKLWSISGLVSGIAVVLLSLRGHLPEFVFYYVAQFLMLIGNWGRMVALRMYLLPAPQARAHATYALVNTAYFAVFCYLIYFHQAEWEALLVFNGFYAYANSQFTKRRSIEGYEFLDGIDASLPNNDPLAFDPYDAFILNFGAYYTPKQRYMREPYRKVVLGSAYPTFSVHYERGLPKVFNSAVDHSYLQFEITQNFKIGTIGTSSYRASVGKFLSARAVFEPDYKFQRRSDPLWFSNPLYSFQGFDTTLRTIDYVLQAHYVHHDNGAILNKIPYFKKTRVGLVVGGGAMYIKEHN